MKSRCLNMLFMTGFSFLLNAQEFQLDRLGKEKWFKYQGQLRASALWYEGRANRDAFGYLIQGNLGLTLAGIYNIPVSFTYTDQEFRFPSPIRLNRFSMRPSYKGLRLYLGDAGMSFMPYTLNGHQFTGVGAEWNGSGGWSVAAMYGRLLKFVKPEAEDQLSPPVLERYGYGGLLGYSSRKWMVKTSVFSGTDRRPDVDMEAAKMFPFPENNLALGLQTKLTLFTKGTLIFDLGHSMLRHRREDLIHYGLTGLPDSISQTRSFNAFKVAMHMPAFTGGMGIAYERVDPGYRTFGAYFFNSDLENLHVTADQSLFKGKLKVGLRSGVQRDNLDKVKKTEFRRFAHSLSLGYTPADRLRFNADYSNFQSISNTRDQFDLINSTNDLELSDTLNYRQVAEQAAVSVFYNFSGPKLQTRSFSATGSYQGNREKGNTVAGPATKFYQGNLSFRAGNAEKDFSWGGTFNISVNKIPNSDQLIYGPGLDASKSFSDSKVKCRLSVAYNLSKGKEGGKSSIVNLRAHSSWRISGNQSLQFRTLYQYRGGTFGIHNDLTVQLNYVYNFDNFRLQLTRQNHSASKGVAVPLTLSFRYREVSYSGTIPEVNQQIAMVRQQPTFLNLPSFAVKKLLNLQGIYLEQDKKGSYKLHALNYLQQLYQYGDLLEKYYDLSDRVMRKIIHDMKKADMELERRYVIGMREYTNTPLANRAPITRVITQCAQRLKGHRWLESRLQNYQGISTDQDIPAFLKTYLDRNLTAYMRKLEGQASSELLFKDLELSLIEHAYVWSLKHIKERPVVLRYYELNP